MAIKTNHILALIMSLIISFRSFVISQNDQDLTKGASFIFGDSLVDAGNNNYLPTLSRANISPNGIDFKASGGTPTGRYTNGRTIGDIVGKRINLIHVNKRKKKYNNNNKFHFDNANMWWTNMKGRN